MKGFWLFTIVCTSSLQAAALTLVNDSHFPLYANIFNAAGDKEIVIQMHPGQTYIWNRDQSPFTKQYDTPTTPYTVRWSCRPEQPYDYSTGKKKSKNKYVSEFGVWNNVPLGATVNALGATGGPLTCTVRKTPSKPQEDSTRPVHKKRKYTNEGFNNWSNDGGQTWTNDAGPGWEDDEEDDGSVSQATPGWKE